MRAKLCPPLHLAPRQRHTSRRQGGFIAYVVAACALLAVLGAATIQVARKSTMGTYVFDTTNSVYAAASLITTKIRYCPLSFPGGNNGTGFAVQYPGAATAADVSTLVCPGRSAYTLFTGADGVFLPQTPGGFTGWSYINDASGVRIVLVSDGSTARNSILANIAKKFNTTAATYSAGTLTVWIKR